MVLFLVETYFNQNASDLFKVAWVVAKPTFKKVIIFSVSQGWLTVRDSRPEHSGNYSCVPSYTTPDWVVVHVIRGES